MKQFFSKPYRWAICFSLLLTSTFVYTLLDAFVIPKEMAQTTTTTSAEVLSSTQSGQPTQTASEANATVTENSYEDENIKIKITTLREYDSNVYVADIQVSDASYLKTALAENTYGRNIKDTTSEIAQSNQAIFAINGDFYGFRNSGYVLRNGVLYRDSVGDSGENQDLVIDDEGNFSIISEEQTSMGELDTDSIAQILAFGPALVEDGEIVVDSDTEVSQSMRSNPRTAIGQISPLHYIVVVSDGRTNESAGLSLLELAQVFADYGCETAYNLDGGGSSTMYFNGQVINQPTNGRSNSEREVSDIVYIGYAA